MSTPRRMTQDWLLTQPSELIAEAAKNFYDRPVDDPIGYAARYGHIRDFCAAVERILESRQRLADREALRSLCLRQGAANPVAPIGPMGDPIAGPARGSA